MIGIDREWKSRCDFMHFNCGCEGMSVGLSENRKFLFDAGILTIRFEGNMADLCDSDFGR